MTDTARRLIYQDEALAGLAAVGSKKTRHQIMTRIEALCVTPYPPGCVKLGGRPAEDVYRVRQGDYRILYRLRGASHLVVVNIGHRRDIYR